MLGNWNLKVNSPGDNLSVIISAKHPVLGDYFVATLKAKRVASGLVSEHAYFFWLMPHKVALFIYWNVSLMSNQYIGSLRFFSSSQVLNCFVIVIVISESYRLFTTFSCSD